MRRLRDRLGQILACAIRRDQAQVVLTLISVALALGSLSLAVITLLLQLLSQL